jgi:hypothetical protein
MRGRHDTRIEIALNVKPEPTSTTGGGWCSVTETGMKKGVRMLDTNAIQANEAEGYLDTPRYLDDVELAGMLLEKAKQNGGKLSYADIVFSQRNFLKPKLIDFS